MPLLPLPDELKQMSDLQRRAFCIGKLFLISITFTDHDGNKVGEVKTEGRLEACELMFGKFRRDDGRLLELPFYVDEPGMWVAQGRFTNHKTGKTVEPDFAIACTLGGYDPADVGHFE
jgi:hypothetical protein